MSDMNDGTKAGEGLSREDLVEELVTLLDVREIGDGLYRGGFKHGGVGRVYGGQVIGQALAAASATVDAGRPVHSLHGYFLREGQESQEIDYRVEADFDGGSFSNRRVVATQRGRVIFNLAASFHRREPGYFHQPSMPDVPPPEELQNIREYVASASEAVQRRVPRFYRNPSPIEVRCVGAPPFCQEKGMEPRLDLWFRAVAPIDQPQWMQRALIAYASDFALIATAMRPYGPFDVQAASLDHSIWFHDDVKMDDWLLYSLDAPWAGGARGVCMGHIFDRRGRLIATVAQEGLMRDKNWAAHGPA